MQPPWREDDKSIDVVYEHLRRPHLLLGEFPGVGQEHLQVDIPSRPLESADHGRKIRIRNVRHDDGDDAGLARLHLSSCPIRDESKPRDRHFDAASGFGCHLLRPTQRARHRCRVHTRFGRHVEYCYAVGVVARGATLLAGCCATPRRTLPHRRASAASARLGAAPGWGCCRPRSRDLGVSIGLAGKRHFGSRSRWN